MRSRDADEAVARRKHRRSRGRTHAASRKRSSPIAAAAAPIAVIQKEAKPWKPPSRTTAAKAQTLFAEPTTRQGRVEKSTKMFEEVNEFAKGNVEAIVESSKIAAKGIETLGQDAAEYGRKHVREARPPR